MSAFTTEELAERKKWIGGSDIAAIVGLNPHATAMSVYLDKTGLFGDEVDTGDGTDPANIGLLQEATIAELYLRRMSKAPDFPAGMRLALRGDGRTTVRRKIEVDGFEVPCQATPDRYVVLLDGEDEIDDWGAEFKMRGRWTSHAWGPSGVGPIPDEVEMQVQWTMGVCEIDRWDVAALVNGNDFRVYTVKFDPEVFEMLLGAARTFWKDLADGKHPDLDTSAATKSYLDTKRMKEKVVDAIAPDTDAAQWIAEVVVAQADVKQAEERLELLKNRLKEHIGERGGLECPYGKVTWFQNKDGSKVDWKLVATKLSEVLTRKSEDGPGLLAEAIAQSTTATVGARSFRITGASDD